MKNYLTDVTENVNAFLANLKSQGAILAGKCIANRELNTAQNISEGKVFFDFEFTPAYPAEQVTFRVCLNNDDIETILLENLARWEEVMLPKILKNFNLYVDGCGYAGRVDEIRS